MREECALGGGLDMEPAALLVVEAQLWRNTCFRSLLFSRLGKSLGQLILTHARDKHTASRGWT